MKQLVSSFSHGFPHAEEENAKKKISNKKNEPYEKLSAEHILKLNIFRASRSIENVLSLSIVISV